MTRKVIAGVGVVSAGALNAELILGHHWHTVLPHIGGLHPQRDSVVAELFAENLRRFLAGKPLLHAVDRARGY